MTDLIIGISLTQEEFVNLFLREINIFIIDVLKTKTFDWIKSNKKRRKYEKQLNELILKMENDTSSNLKMYLDMLEGEIEFENIIRNEFINITLKALKLNKNINNFDIHYLFRDNRDEFVICYSYNFSDLDEYIKISELNFDTDIIIKFLNNHRNKLLLKNNNITKDICNIINKYLVIDINKKKIETVLVNYD